MAKKANTKAPDVEVLPPMTEEIELAQEAGLTIKSFLSGAVAFFTRTAELERDAVARLKRAETWVAPKNGKEDEALQTEIVEAKEAIAAGETHWQIITSTLHGWHKRSTARRSRITGDNAKAAEIGQALHNGWVDSEHARVAREADEERQRGEREAAAKRQKELDDLEAAAVAAEKKSPALSAREQAFVDAIMGQGSTKSGDYSVRRAAELAGFKDPAAAGARLLDTPKVAKAIAAAQKARNVREQAAALEEKPLEVDLRPTKAADVRRAVGVTERESHTAEVVDIGALVEAFRSGKYGIPGNIFAINQAELNTIARSLRDNISRWPGVKYHRNRSTT